MNGNLSDCRTVESSTSGGTGIHRIGSASCSIRRATKSEELSSWATKKTRWQWYWPTSAGDSSDHHTDLPRHHRNRGCPVRSPHTVIPHKRYTSWEGTSSSERNAAMSYVFLPRTR